MKEEKMHIDNTLEPATVCINIPDDNQFHSIEPKCDFCDKKKKTLKILAGADCITCEIEVCADCLHEAGVGEFIEENRKKEENHD